MPADLRIEGTEQLERVARRLKDLGDGELRKELYRAIQRATKPLKAKAKDAALRDLPQRGGLNKWVASSKFSTRTRGGGRNPGVKIVAKKGTHDLRALDRGRLRHPVYGNRRVWVNQSVKPGWFSKSMEDGAPDVRRELLGVLEDVARQVRGSGG